MITGRLEVLQGPMVAYSVFPTDLPSDDKHNMQLDPKYIPRPTVNKRLASAFHLPIDVNMVYDTSFSCQMCRTSRIFSSFCQLLDDEKLLLILVEQDRVIIYLERLSAMGIAIQRRRPVKILSRERLEEDVLFAFDEKTRVLAVCAPIKVLYVLLTSEFLS